MRDDLLAAAPIEVLEAGSWESCATAFEAWSEAYTSLYGLDEPINEEFANSLASYTASVNAGFAACINGNDPNVGEIEAEMTRLSEAGR